MDEKELETYRKKQQKTDFRGRVTDTVFAADEIVVTEAGYEAVLAAEKAKKRFRKHQRLRQASLWHRMRQKIP